MRLFILSFLILIQIPFYGFGQFFQIYNHQVLDSFSGFSDIVVDSNSIQVVGGSGYNPIRSPLLIEEIEDNGYINNIFTGNNSDTTIQITTANGTKLFKNYRGNYMIFFIDNHITFSYIKCIEADINGNLIFDTVFTDNTLIQDNFQPYTMRCLQNSDSTFTILANSARPSSNSSGYISSLDLISISDDFEIQNIQNIQVSNSNSVFRLGNILKRANGNTLLTYNYIEPDPDPSYGLSYMFLKEYDSNMNQLYSKKFNPTTKCYGGLGLLDLDTAIVFTFSNSSIGVQNTFYDFNLFCFNFSKDSIIWKRNLIPFKLTMLGSESLINDIILNDNNEIVFALSRYEPDDSLKHRTIELQNTTLNGELNWYRNYKHYGTNSVEYSTYKIVQFNNHYYGCGKLMNHNFILANKPGQFAYVFKTNCLGFLEAPELDIQTSINENQLIIQNNSSYFDSLFIDYGDGITQIVHNSTDSIEHIYKAGGDYELIISPIVCSNEMDTSFTEKINIINKSESIKIYPNPVTSNHFKVEGYEGEIFIYNQLGQIVQEVAISKKQGTYHILNNLAAGTYSAVLKYDGKLICKRLVVL